MSRCMQPLHTGKALAAEPVGLIDCKGVRASVPKIDGRLSMWTIWGIDLLRGSHLYNIETMQWMVDEQTLPPQ